jgi:F420-non-reducing hydrogenase small subunit
MKTKPKLAMYWASSCGGCEIALVNLHDKILQVDQHFDFVFCPCLLDTKYEEIEAMPDGSLAVTLFNGAIRTDENAEMARLLRRKSKVLVAFGSCAMEGCIPALSNLHTRDEHFEDIYLKNSTVENPDGLTPTPSFMAPEGELQLPTFHDSVRTLTQVVEVEYSIPGCPPEPHRIWEVVEALISGQPLPPPGTVLGGGQTTVCDACTREKREKKIQRFYRNYEIIPDPDTCLLEQGLLCMGVTTRDGCGALCPQVNMPCTGCYGPPEGVRDQGAKMTAALGSVLDVGDYKGLSEAELDRRIEEALATLPDPAGSMYRYSLAGSLLGGRVR